MKKQIISILIAILVIVPVCRAQSSILCSDQRKVRLPNGECIAPERIQELFDRSAVIAGKYYAANDLLKIREEQLKLAEAREKTLTETVSLYAQVTEELKSAVTSYKEAISLKDASIAERDKRIKEADERIAKLEKKKLTLFKAIKLIGTGLAVGFALGL